MSVEAPEMQPVITSSERDTFDQIVGTLDDVTAATQHAVVEHAVADPEAKTGLRDRLTHVGIYAHVDIQSRQNVDGSAIERKLEGSKWGRAALRVGVVTVAATAVTLLSRTANAYAQTKGLDLGMDNLQLASGIPVDDSDTLSNGGGKTAAQPNYETYGGRKVDMNDYKTGDTTRTFDDNDSLKNYAKDDLAVALEQAGVDDKHIDDILDNKHAVDYVVDGYKQDTDNKDIFGKKYAIKEGAEVTTDDARTRAATIATNVSTTADELEKLNIKVTDDMVAKTNGHNIHLNDYTDNQVTAYAGDSAWSKAEHDLIIEGKKEGLTDNEIDKVLSGRNVAKVTDGYIDANKSIDNHPKHWMMKNETYDATEARERADKIVEDFIEKRDEAKKDKANKDETTVKPDTRPSGHPTTREDNRLVEPRSHDLRNNTQDPRFAAN